jgi:hypothetical protein
VRGEQKCGVTAFRGVAVRRPQDDLVGISVEVTVTHYHSPWKEIVAVIMVMEVMEVIIIALALRLAVEMIMVSLLLEPVELL